jgi:hypothetical protein
MTVGTNEFLAKALLDHIGATTALGLAGTEIYMALHTAEPTSGGVGSIANIVSGGNYENELLTFGDASTASPSVMTGTSASSATAFCTGAALTYSATGVDHFSLHACATEGAVSVANMILCGALGGSVDLSVDDTITLTDPLISLAYINTN